MTSGWGVEPTLDGSGNATSGTTSQDIRKILGGLYTKGIISGCTVTTSASAMTYTVNAGVVAISVASDEIILADIPVTTITTTSAPVSGTRTDIIYAQQRYPSIEGNSSIVVSVGTSLPARAVRLQSRVVSAGNINTNSTVITGGTDYSIPYGASLGILWKHQTTYNGTFTTRGVMGSASIYLPTDRNLKFTLSTTMSANAAVGFDNTKYCEGAFDIFIDNVKQWGWSTPGLHQAWAEFTWSDNIILTAGSHTLRYERFVGIGPGTPFQHYSLAGNKGSQLIVEDLGPAV